jgi:peptidoglycan/LPS O-acetylase OafA/YrhL
MAHPGAQPSNTPTVADGVRVGQHPARADLKRLGYQPALDGLRTFAVVAVIASHSRLWTNSGGWLGVDVFFALSGFLITSLLLDEWVVTAAIRLPAFYARRALRLMPPLLAFVAVVTLGELLWGSTGDRHSVLHALPWVLGYAANWGQLGRVFYGPFDHLWSLAVEEQFYIFWAPVVLAALSTRYRERAVLWAALVGVVASNAVRLAVIAGGVGGNRLYGTDARSDGIFLGCAAAVLWSQGRFRLPVWVERGMGVAAAAVLVDLAWHPTVPGGRYSTDVLLVAVYLATVTLIVSVVAQPLTMLGRLLASPPLVWLGKRSYAMYLWHFPITWTLVLRNVAPVPTFVLAMAGAVAMAHLSMLVIEGPLLPIRRRFGYGGGRAVPAPAPPDRILSG